MRIGWGKSDNSGLMNKWQIKVDEDVSALGERIAGLEQGIKSIGLRMGDLIKSFESHTKMQQEATKAPYGTIIAGFILVVMVVGLIIGSFSAGYVRDMKRIEESQKSLIAQTYLHETKTGHPALTQQVRMLIGITGKLDESLQREMRLLNDTIISKVEALDVRLQREMELRNQAYKESLRAVERKVFERTK